MLYTLSKFADVRFRSENTHKELLDANTPFGNLDADNMLGRHLIALIYIRYDNQHVKTICRNKSD